MNPISRLFQRMTGKSAEGSYRGPAVGLSHWGNAFPIGFGDGFQDGLTLQTGAYGTQGVPIAFACVMLGARALALCPAYHYKKVDGKKVLVENSPTSKILRYANPYQTWTQFVLNVVAALGFDGESFALIVRDPQTFAPTAIHLMPRGTCSPYVDQETGEVFYSVGANPMIPGGSQYMVPARDIIHFRQYCPRHPLIGETPLKAAALALGINVALSTNQTAFFSQMSRPSGIISTDTMLTRAQIQELRKAFDEQAAGMNAGKIPILGAGLKFQPLSIDSQDAQLIDAQRMSIEEVARVFGIPLPLIGDPTTGGVSNTESLISFWLATGLGALLENIETSLERAFDLPVGESIDIDETALLRTDLKSRVDAYTKGTQGGLYTPNEARDFEGLPPLKGGDEIYMQRQMTAVDQLAALGAAELANAIAPPPAPMPAPVNDDDETPPTPAPIDADVTAALAHDLIRRKRA